MSITHHVSRIAITHHPFIMLTGPWWWHCRLPLMPVFDMICPAIPGRTCSLTSALAPVDCAGGRVCAACTLCDRPATMLFKKEIIHRIGGREMAMLCACLLSASWVTCCAAYKDAMCARGCREWRPTGRGTHAPSEREDSMDDGKGSRTHMLSHMPLKPAPL